MDDDNDERASNRLAAETFMPMMVEAFHDGLQEAGSLSRWLLATLVAINGAAAITMLPLKMASGSQAGWGSGLPSWNPGGLGRWFVVPVRFQAREHVGWDNAGLLANGRQRRRAHRSSRGNDEKAFRPSHWIARDPLPCIRERGGVSRRLRFDRLGNVGSVTLLTRARWRQLSAAMSAFDPFRTLSAQAARP